MGPIQTIDYSYHIRGGLKGINLPPTPDGGLNTAENDLFMLRLEREEDGRYYNGQISKQTWLSKTPPSGAGGLGGVRSFTYTYDQADRFKQATYTGDSGENYNLTGVSYDLNGNIQALQRSGKNASGGYGLIDNLSYNYGSTINQLQNITDAADPNIGYKTPPSGGGGASYYPDGSLKSDANRGITNIIYNYLGLPEKIDFGSNRYIANLYDATGFKMRQTIYDNGQQVVTDYIGDLVYRNDTLQSIAHDEGISRPLDATNTDFLPQFFYADHLGNTRLIYAVAPNGAYIVQENHYGPMGELLEGLGNRGSWTFLYQGKEYIEAFGYNGYDFHARGYNAFTGRFDGVDAVDHFGMSGYTGMANNPINTIDPDGKNPLIAALVGGLIGGAGYTLSAAFEPGGLKANWRLGQFAKSVGIGAISGVFSFGIGEAAIGMSSIGKFIFQTGMHGYIGGFSSVMQGGSFGSGFATGAAGSIVGVATANMSAAVQIGASALFSGGVAELSGGNFWQGAAQGAIIAGFNHSLHEIERTAWDLNYDGILQKKEADEWWINGRGKPIGVDNSKIDWSGLKVPNEAKDGDIFSVNTTEAFRTLPYETAATYGGTSFKLISRKQSLARVLDQDYHYNIRKWNSAENVGRNVLTQLGKPSGNGRTYNIHYFNPRFRIPKK